MLDPKFIKDHLEAVVQGAKSKGFFFDSKNFLELYEKRLKTLQETEELRNRRNLGSEAIKKVVDATERKKLIENMRIVGKELESTESKLRELEESFQSLLFSVPSIPSEDTPIGGSDADNKELYRVGQIPDFSFSPKSHIEIGLGRDLIDFDRGIKTSGARSYYLKGAGAELERAVQSLAIDLLLQKNYTQLSVPTLVKSAAMEGTGYLPGFADQAYYIEKDKFWLIGTSEVPLAAYHQNEVLMHSDFPIKLFAWSTCYRREAGAAGKDTKGLYRVHQFQKVEQVILCESDIDVSDKLHQELLQNSLDILNLLELPYRVVQVCTGDLGLGQVKKNDVEVWMPSRNNYGETHSCSSFYDFQARRLKIRYKDKDGQTKFCYTLNNTAVATPRILIPLLENHQTEDGRVKIPKALQKYMGGRIFL